MLMTSKGLRLVTGLGRRWMIRSSLSTTTAARHPMVTTTGSSNFHQQARVLAVAGLGFYALSTATNNENNKTYNHCQVPCGIFDDPAIVNEMKQAVATIRKAMVQTNALGSQTPTDALALNQAVRWITVKEEHASKIITTVAEYCLCQRVKRPLFATQAEYLEALELHHKVMQAAMKAKQSVSVKDCDSLEKAVQDLAKMYTK